MAMKRLARPVTLTRALMENAMQEAAMEVRHITSTNMKNLAASA